MENRFDDLTKALAEGIPRRQALRRLAGLFGGALLGSLAFGGSARAHKPFKCGKNVCPPGSITCCGFFDCCPWPCDSNGNCTLPIG
jgi:hypothetical protein